MATNVLPPSDLAPAALLASAKCYKCIPVGEQQAVIIYLLNEILGTGLTPAQLMTAAKCYKCIPIGMQPEVITYLLCQIANSGGIVTCTFLEGAGDPTGSQTPDFVGQLYHDTNTDSYYRSTGTNSADWTAISGGVCANVEGAGDPT